MHDAQACPCIHVEGKCTTPTNYSPPARSQRAATLTEGKMDNTKFQNAIYAVLDVIAHQLVGGLYLHKHEAAAVRFFADVATMPDSLVGKHPQDFDLVRLGYITHDNVLEPEHTVILKGSIWAAAREDSTKLQLEA